MPNEIGRRRRVYLRTYQFAAGTLIVAATGLNPAAGCGPDFPNWLLANGDQAVLIAPEGNFAAELASMSLGRARVRAIPPDSNQDYAKQSTESELADLRNALKQAGTLDSEASRICVEHERQRRQLAEFIEVQQIWKKSHLDDPKQPQSWDEEAHASNTVVFNVWAVEGLPDEFADYFEGFIAWHNPAQMDKQVARSAWERLLGRPETQRRYKSTWATFMLGKSWEEADPEKAVSLFRHVRELVRQGYRDTLGLAAASLGLEAKICLQQANYEAAIELYLDQMASGDPTAANSLATAAAKALTSGSGSLCLLAKNPRSQKVITAYVISRRQDNSVYRSKSSENEEETFGTESATTIWLKAVEQAQIKDVESAEALALAAYRANEMALASRWIARSQNSPVAQWLRAKLLLRDGKLQIAAALLAKISQQFPIIHEGINAPAPISRKDTLTVAGDDFSYYRNSAERQIHGELGVLHLACGDYVQALDSLLNAGFWMDAAYVADRVLTVDELKTYVDRFWPAATADQVVEEQKLFAGSEVCPSILREQIRYLLARRLTRELRGDQAREYYPEAWVGTFDQLAANLRSGWNETLEARERAMALFQAARIMRANGMELVGTEVAPDWHYHLGEYEQGVTGEDRGTNPLAVVVRPLKDELRRAADHGADPNLRFHYRYQAASLAWEAAKLLPDNDDLTAFVLWQGGSFVKSRDPKYADLFYKALVRRNRKTVLGAEADRQRWFPIIDDNGNIVPKENKSEVPKEW